MANKYISQEKNAEGTVVSPPQLYRQGLIILILS